MITKPKSNSIVTTELADNIIIFNVQGAGSLNLDMAVVDKEILKRAAIHGLVQRISDAAAMSRDTDTGQPATPADKFERMKELVDYYNSGAAEWRRVKASGAGAGNTGGGLLLKCLVIMKPEKTKEEIAEWLKKLTKKEKFALLGSKQVKAVADTIRGKQAENVDSEELLNGL